MEEEKKVITTNLRCPSDIYNQIKYLAKEEDRSINYMIVKILKDFVKKKNPPM